ncbi:MAG: flagellar basal-body rod protein FlgF [Rhodocyclaceae bacterium]
MDKLIYTAMSGAKATMSRQASVANNLANVSTTGFRAEMNRLRAVPVQSEALPSRAHVVEATLGADMRAGAIMQTGRSLDMAIQGEGWFAVRAADGSEAYTRDGSFTVDANGMLRTRSGLEVLDDGGNPITLPPDNSIELGGDGTLTATPRDGTLNAANPVARLKLVNPDPATMQRRDDGLFRTAGNQPAAADDNVKALGGALEGSNVSMVNQMVQMISLQRHYEMHTKLLQTAQEDDRAATQILSRT